MEYSFNFFAIVVNLLLYNTMFNVLIELLTFYN